MNKRFEELAEYFCFDRKKTSVEEFFGDLSTFIKDFEVGFTMQCIIILCFLTASSQRKPED